MSTQPRDVDLSRTRFANAVAVLAIIAVALNLRPALTTVGPVLPEIITDLGLTMIQGSVLSSLSLFVFAIAAPLVPRIGARLGIDRAVLVSLVVLAAALALRPWFGYGGLVLGTAVAAGAIAVGNVLMPALIRRDFPVQAVRLTGVYSVMLAVGASLGAGVTVPVATVGGGWQWGLAVWAGLAVLGAVAWGARRSMRTGRAALPGHWRSALTSPVAWQVSAYLGTQSIGFYCVTTWMPFVLRDAGIAPGRAGLMLSLALGFGAVSGLVIPQLAAGHRDQRIPAAGTVVFTIAGMLGLALAPAAAPPLWALLLGIGQGGTFPLAVSLIIMRSRTTELVPTLSAMAHAVGYTMSATGPLLMGAIRTASGSWAAALSFVVAVAVAQLIFGVLAGRDRTVG